MHAGRGTACGPTAGAESCQTATSEYARAKVNSSGYRGRMDHPDQVAVYVARTVLGEATTPESLAAGAWSTAYALAVAGQGGAQSHFGCSCGVLRVGVQAQEGQE